MNDVTHLFLFYWHMISKATLQTTTHNNNYNLSIRLWWLQSQTWGVSLRLLKNYKTPVLLIHHIHQIAIPDTSTSTRYISLYRYRVDLAGENWKLALADAKVSDSGVYCCHVSTHPPMLRRFQLNVHRKCSIFYFGIL